MQQKRSLFRVGNVIILVAVAVVVAIGALMTVNIPAPQKPVEKELDAKAFLEQKQ